MPAEAISKTAYAIPTEFTIGYNNRLGTVDPANPTTYDVETATFTLTNPERIHSKFA